VRPGVPLIGIVGGRPLAARRSATDERWRLAVAGVPLTVERLAGGGWSVLLGGFSRASGERLVEAIAVATGAQSHDAWIVELADRIERAV
jgi:uncharacterized circularly permuted ATP-grasp superfamily protein